MVGFAFFQYLQATLNSFSAKIRREQLTGTLEAMLVTPTRASLVILGSTIWDFLMTTIRVGIILVLGSLLAWGFGERVGMRAAGLPAFLLLLALTVAAFSGIGILSAAFTIWLKRFSFSLKTVSKVDLSSSSSVAASETSTRSIDAPF